MRAVEHAQRQAIMAALAQADLYDTSVGAGPRSEERAEEGPW